LRLRYVDSCSTEFSNEFAVLILTDTQVANDHLETLEKLTLALQRIVASLERYANYEMLFKNHMNTQKAICTLYVDLLDLCTRVIRFHSRSSICKYSEIRQMLKAAIVTPAQVVVFSSFKREFEQVYENISHHSTQIDWAANAANIEEAKKARADDEAARQGKLSSPRTESSLINFEGEIRSKIQKWLSPSTVQDDLSRHNSDCMPGTCDWAFATEQLQDFINSKKSSVLRIGGAPGSGKSTSNHGDVLYFFCRGTDETKRHIFQVIRTLLSQLLTQDPSLYPWFEGVHNGNGQREARSLSDLKSWLKTALSKTSKTLVYVVVDALDECEEGKETIATLLGMAQMSNKPEVKLLMTSREDHELLEATDGTLRDLIISPNNIRGLIWNYVDNRVAKCKNIHDTPLGLRVKSEVTAAANGLWLYARLMMDEIQRLPSKPSIERQLLNIPRGLSELYQQIFDAKGTILDERQMVLAQHVFLWIDMATFVHVGDGPLNRNILDIVIQAANNGEEVFDSLELAKQLCSPLVELFEDETGTLSIEFIHHTAAQYTRECSRGRIENPPVILKPQLLKRLYHGTTSVWFFSNSPMSIKALESIRIHHDLGAIRGYFEMAYGLWDAFFLSSLPSRLNNEEIEEASRLCNIMSNFLQSNDCLIWIEMAIIGNYFGNWVDLLLNSLKARQAGCAGLESNTPAFQSFSTLRREFFDDYSYVLYLTGPQPVDQTYRESCKKPDGFEHRPMAMKILALGNRWKSLVIPMFRVGDQETEV